MARHVRRSRSSSIKRANTATTGMAPNRPRTDRRSRTDELRLNLNRLRPSQPPRALARTQSVTPAVSEKLSPKTFQRSYTSKLLSSFREPGSPGERICSLGGMREDLLLHWLHRIWNRYKSPLQR